MQARRFSLAAVFAAMVVLVWAQAPMVIAQEKEVVTVRGANAMAPIMDRLAQEFSKVNPGYSVVVAGGGTDAGFDALFEKAAHLVMASRKILVKEMQAAMLAEVKPAECFTTRSCVVFFTKADNPVNELTLEQLRGIWSGDITKWKEVGGPDAPIRLVGSPEVAGMSQFLKEKLLNGGLFASEIQVREFYSHIIRDIPRVKEPAIGYADLALALVAEQRGQVKILAVKPESGGSGIKPSAASLANGSYPLIIPMFMYWDENKISKGARDFVKFCETQAPSGSLTSK
ncbi:MAG: substrate-binding domain-containing protein [Thermodesulfobacteriota bacterium]